MIYDIKVKYNNSDPYRSVTQGKLLSRAKTSAGTCKMCIGLN